MDARSITATIQKREVAMHALKTTITLSAANKCFEGMIPELRRAIEFRLQTVALVKGGKNKQSPVVGRPANDNDCPLSVDLTVPCTSAQGTTASNDQHEGEPKGAQGTASTPISLRPMRYSEVRTVLLGDQDIRDEILCNVYQDFIKAVEKGDFCGEADRALVFEIVRCRSIKAVRPRARLLLRTMLTTDGSAAIDHLVAPQGGAEEEASDRLRALSALRPLFAELAEPEAALLQAKLEGRLNQLAADLGEKPSTIRVRAKRLFDRIVTRVRAEVAEGPMLPTAA